MRLIFSHWLRSVCEAIACWVLCNPTGARVDLGDDLRAMYIQKDRKQVSCDRLPLFLRAGSDFSDGVGVGVAVQVLHELFFCQLHGTGGQGVQAQYLVVQKPISDPMRIGAILHCASCRM